MVGPSLERVDQKLDDLIKSVDEIKSNMDKKYASKWVEKLATGLVAFVMLTVLYAVIHKVIPDSQSHSPSASEVTAK